MAKQTTNYQFPVWCPNCRVNTQEFKGDWSGSAVVGQGSLLAKEITTQLRCNDCKKVYTVIVKVGQDDKGQSIAIGAFQPDLEK